MRGLRWLLAAAVLAFSGCTFGGLADYDIQDCSPAASQAADECATLDTDPTTCSPYQCDAKTRRCVRRLRDDDHDGDPAASCSPAGTGDCDDQSPNVSSLGVGAPEALAGAELPEDIAKLSLSSDGGNNPALAFVTKSGSGECLSVAAADVASTTPLAGCQLLQSNLGALPTQIDARRVGSGSFVAAFVSLSGCSAGKLAVAYADKLAVETSCVGAARPALAMLDSSSAIVAWYAAPASSRTSALDDCSAALPAPLRLRRIASVASPSFETPVTLDEETSAMQAPALIVRDGIVFVASPAQDRVVLWALDSGLNVLSQVVIGAMRGARSASMAAQRRGDGSWRLGIVSDLGCVNQSVQMALVDFDPAVSKFETITELPLASPSALLQWQPSIAWVASRQRWLAAWMVNGPKPVARFISEDGEPGTPAFDLAPQSLAVKALSSGRVAFVGGGDGGQQLLASPARCP